MATTRPDPINFRDHQLKEGNALQRDAKGNAIACLSNIDKILRGDSRWADVLGFNEMGHLVVKRKLPPFEGGTLGAWSDVDEIRTQIWLSREYGFNAKVNDVRQCILSAATSAPFHPVREYLDGLAWDGEPRVREAVFTHFGAEDAGERGEYHMLAFTKWLLSAVARIYRPGCKADNVLILEGPQGKLKSTSLAALGGEWFMDTPFHIGSRDAFLVLQGMWIVELAELDGFTRAESSAAKAFFSSPKDRYVPKYIAHPVQVLRSCVFAGTVNLGAYLHDKTGNRRYWPVRVGKIDLEALVRDRDQLWAEAVQLYRDGVKWYVEPDEVEKFAVEQEAREIPDALEDRIREYLAGQPETSMMAILEGCLALEYRDWSHALQTRIGQILAKLGWEVAERKRSDKTSRRRVYRPKAAPPDSAPQPVQPGPTSPEGGPPRAKQNSDLP